MAMSDPDSARYVSRLTRNTLALVLATLLATPGAAQLRAVAGAVCPGPARQWQSLGPDQRRALHDRALSPLASAGAAPPAQTIRR